MKSYGTEASDSIDAASREDASFAQRRNTQPRVCFRTAWSWKTVKGALPALLLSAFVMGGWGVSFFVNSVTNRLLGPNSTTFQALFLNVLGRSLALLVVIPILEFTQQPSAKAKGVAGQDTAEPLLAGFGGERSGICGRCRACLRPRGPPRTLAITWDLAVPFAGQILTNFAFVPYIELAGESEVSVLTVMTGLHSVLPAAWGLVVWGEERTWPKLAGIALSAAAVLLLGLADATSFLGSATTAAEISAKVALFIMATAMWGGADILNACVRRLSASETAMLTLAANLVSAVVFAWVGLVQDLRMLSNVTCGDVAALQSTVPFGWRHIVMLLANALGMFGSLAYIRLGQIGEASAFAPVVALYVYVPVILAAALLDERLRPMQVGGILVAGAAVVLLSASWGSSKRKPKGEGDAAEQLLPGAELPPLQDASGVALQLPQLETESRGSDSVSETRPGLSVT